VNIYDAKIDIDNPMDIHVRQIIHGTDGYSLKGMNIYVDVHTWILSAAGF